MKPHSVHIRQASKGDLPTVLAIERDNMREIVDRLNPEPWSDATCMIHLRAVLQRRSLWVCEVASRVVGHYSCSPMKKPGYVSLDSMQVARSHQRQGIGSLLLTHFLAGATEGGFDYAALNVHVGNPALRFYERFGFSEVRRSENHIRMEKSLLAAKGAANKRVQPTRGARG